MGTNTERRIVFFDGICNLCNSSINFIIDRDPLVKFRFAPLQSDLARELLCKYEINTENLESLVYYDGKNIYRRSRAVLEIVKRMRRLWPLLYVFILIPAFVRDIIYDFVAKNRYKWFGHQSACRVPTSELRARFLE